MGNKDTQPAAPLTVPASSLVPANTVGGYSAPTVLAAPATGYSPAPTVLCNRSR